MSVTILNFHGVGPLTRAIDAGERNCWLDQNHFEAVLDLVSGQKHIRLTVDDGNASDFDFILPALLRRGLTASFFVCSGLLDQPTYLTRKQVQELQAGGMTIGSHGTLHRAWSKLSPIALTAELQDSRVALEEICRTKIDTAACPFGAYNRKVLNALRRAGYHTVYTSDKGSASESDWMRARNTVLRSTPLTEIEKLVRQGPTLAKQSLINARKLIKRLK